MTKKQIRELDTLWSKKIKERANYVCEKCGKHGRLNSHHLFTKHNRSVRWNLTNGICLCVGCHVFSTDAAHAGSLDFGQWFIQTRGQDLYETLSKLAHQVAKNQDFEEIKQLLE